MVVFKGGTPYEVLESGDLCVIQVDIVVVVVV